jgi:hypothetical protein
MTDTTQGELPIWVSTAPTDICLGLYWDGGSDEEHAGFPDDHEDICWSEGKNGHGDDNVHYVRADIANKCIATLKAENERLLAEVEQIGLERLHPAQAELMIQEYKDKAEAMAGLLEEARNSVELELECCGDTDDLKQVDDLLNRIDAALAAWKGETP